MSDETKKVSEAKGPYKHYRLCDEAPCVKGSCMACVYAEGRASRDGLRKALESIGGIVKTANGIVEIGLIVDESLEADGEEK